MTGIFKIAGVSVLRGIVKLFFARDHRRCRVATQIEAAREWGCEDRQIWTLGTKRDQWSWQRLIAGDDHLIRAGDELGVYHAWLLPLTGKGASPSPGRQLRQIFESLLKRSVRVTELSSGRSTVDTATTVAIYDDAIKVLAGRSGSQAGPGRPKLHSYTEDDWLVIEAVWRRPGFKNNRERVEAVRAHDERFKRFTQAVWYQRQER